MAEEPLMLPAVPADVSYEVELDDQADTRPVLFEAPPPPAELRPVIPPQLRRTAAAAAVPNPHRAKYHGFQSGWYLLQALAWAAVRVVPPGARHAGWWSERGARRV